MLPWFGLNLVLVVCVIFGCDGWLCLAISCAWGGLAACGRVVLRWLTLAVGLGDFVGFLFMSS